MVAHGGRSWSDGSGNHLLDRSRLTGRADPNASPLDNRWRAAFLEDRPIAEVSTLLKLSPHPYVAKKTRTQNNGDGRYPTQNGASDRTGSPFVESITQRWLLRWGFESIKVELDAIINVGCAVMSSARAVHVPMVQLTGVARSANFRGLQMPKQMSRPP